MSTIATAVTGPADPPAAPKSRTPLGPLTARSLRSCLRTPSLLLSPLLTSAFFLIIYEGQLSSVTAATAPGGRYIDVVLPLCLLTTAFTGGATAGQLLVSDIGSGYHARLWLTPVGRWTLITAPVLAGVVVLTAQAAALTGLGLLLGLSPVSGAPALLALIGATVLLGTGFLLLAAAVGLHTGNSSAVGSVTLVFFPLSFFTATFVPRDQLGGWMAHAADINPLTPPLEAMRTLLASPWNEQNLLPGALVALAILVAGAAAAHLALTRRTRTGV
ncbi:MULTISPECIES: ABC transporter permease [Streptomyces]|uniref:Transport permease protein n=1 Tax=Streptomyces parvus TaxID=66428 RepID=A0A5D4JJA6_9ACTN|nr:MULTISPECIES: ABC transporter permease [Streptomyces]PVC86495.1 ABC transporter permease [Streptomyces sp. CS014]TYR64290.1 ABC transporter permease [Streptomyces parvus]